MRLLEGAVGFLIGNQLVAPELHPGLGIKQGHTLSPTIFSLTTAVLSSKVKQRLPQVESFLFTDDTLFFILGTPAQVRATLQTLLGLPRQYGDVSRYRLNIDKCVIVCQGPDTLPHGTLLLVRRYARKLNTWEHGLGRRPSWNSIRVRWQSCL